MPTNRHYFLFVGQFLGWTIKDRQKTDVVQFLCTFPPSLLNSVLFSIVIECLLQDKSFTLADFHQMMSHLPEPVPEQVVPVGSTCQVHHPMVGSKTLTPVKIRLTGLNVPFINKKGFCSSAEK